MLEFTFELGIIGWLTIVVAALAFGVVAQLVGETRTGYEWLVDAIAVAVGAIVASEFVIAWQAIVPVFDGLALIPALFGGLAVGLIVEVITRFATGGHYVQKAVHA
jgi:uncharacterized membrane protein YeaQ/YmgE (transglycosylase-associated protein family)